MGIFTPNIRKLQKEKNIPELLKCLDHKRSNVRYSAFVALTSGSGLNDEIINKLRNMVHDPDPWVKTIAILKFADIGDASISDSLMEIIIEGSRNARIELLKIIAERGANNDEIIMEVIINALSDKQEIVRRQAIITAGATRNKRLLPYLSESLHEKHHDSRIYAAKALYDIAGRESADYLIGLLADKDPKVQASARSYLANIDYEHVKKALHDAHFMQFIKGMNDREPVRKATAQKIGKESIREGLPLLHRACRDKYKDVRVEALKAIAAFRDPSSIEFVEKLLEDKFHSVRIEAVHTLEEIGGPRSREALKNAINSKDRQVREAAQRVHHRTSGHQS